MTVVFTLVVSACGSSGGGGGADEAAGTTSTTGAQTESPSTSTTASGDGGDGGGLADADCRFLLAGELLNPLAGIATGGKIDLEATADQLAEIKAAAPAEIEDAMATVADGMAALADALQGVDITDPQSFADPDVQSKLQELGTQFSDDAYTAAATEVTDYIAQHCGG